jgi:methionine synthase II (cobalamin-independent)
MASMFRPLLQVAIAVMLISSIAVSQAPKSKAATAKVFPYKIYTRTLANGLNVVIIPTPEFKDMVTYSTAVFAGSRNETQRGKTGLAHLFEHEMFLHQYNGAKGGYEEQIRAMGAHNNAWTDYDMTFFHPTTFTSNLVGPIKRPQGSVPGLIEIEASRFQQLSIDRKTFAPNEARIHARPYHSLEELAQNIAVSEPAMAINREGRMIRDLIFQTQSAEPPIGEMELNLLA